MHFPFCLHDVALSFETSQVSDLAGEKSREMCVSPAEYKMTGAGQKHLCQDFIF